MSKVNCPVRWDKVPLMLDLKRASPIAGRCTKTLQTMARKGEFPAFQTCRGGKWMVPKNKLQQWIENGGGRPWD